MLVSKTLQYGNPNVFNNGGYTITRNMNSLNYFTDNSVFGPSGEAANTFPSNGWGGFTITDENDANKLLIPFDVLNSLDNNYYENQFKYLNETWIVQYGWAVNGIFIFSVYQQTGQPIKFKISFGGHYYTPAVQSSDYCRNGEVSQIINNKFANSTLNLYTHYHWYYNSENSVKATYTVVPFQVLGMNQKPFTSTYTSVQYKYQTSYNYYYGWNYVYSNYINKEVVNTTALQYGCTMYVQWGKQVAGKTMEIDLQNWVLNDLQMGANFKMCNYTNPIKMQDYSGTRETKEIDISQSVVCNSNTVTWVEDTPIGSKISVEANISLNGGINWSGWKTIQNGGSIPQLINGMNLSNGFVKFRETLYASDEQHIPKLFNLQLNIVCPKFKYLVSDNDDIKTRMKDYDWVQYKYNATGYMETDTYPEPYVCNCSTVFNSTYSAYKAFNHTNDTTYDCWASSNGITTGWLSYDFGLGNSERLYKYVVTSRNNSDIDSAPKDWTLKASDDGITWVLIDTQTLQINWKRAESRIFPVTMNISYRMYKLDMTSNNGNSSTITVGELELYPLRYEVTNQYWQSIPGAQLNKDTFQQYGFDNIEDFDGSLLEGLSNVKILMSMDNLIYMPHFEYRGFVKTTNRSKIEIKETGVQLKPWTDFLKNDYNSQVSISSKLINSIKPKNIQITSETDRGIKVEKLLPISIYDDKPLVQGSMTNTLLKVLISDKNKDKMRFNVSLNGIQFYPEIGKYTEWLNGPINYKYNFNSKEMKIGIINTVDIYVEDEYGLSDTLSLTFSGNYSGIIFKDDSGNVYNSDLGEILKYVDFGSISSGKTTDVKKITFQNKNGYPIKNIHIGVFQPYQDAALDFSFTNNPFMPVGELTYQRTFYPEQTGIFYARMRTNVSQETTTRVFTAKVTAEPVS